MANVPNVPGVPNLGSYTSAVVTLLVADGLNTLLNFLRPQWGLYQGNIPILPVDNVVSFDFRQDWSIADFPVEKGAFESYDKVTNPFSVRLRLSVGGNELKREGLLTTLRELAPTTDIFDAVTPEETYENVTIEHYDYNRNARNVGLLVVDLWCKEVRIEATSSFTKSTSSADVVNKGQVQGTAPSKNQELKAAEVQ